VIAIGRRSWNATGVIGKDEALQISCRREDARVVGLDRAGIDDRILPVDSSTGIAPGCRRCRRRSNCARTGKVSAKRRRGVGRSKQNAAVTDAQQRPGFQKLKL